jgi:hypothetical protein
MRVDLLRVVLGCAAVLLMTSECLRAGVIQAQGSVTALTDISQMDPFFVADFDDVGNPVPRSTYSNQGLDLVAGGTDFSDILAGIVSDGSASNVSTSDHTTNLFPASILGGGSTSGHRGRIGLTATFNRPVTQVGATFSKNGKQYITAWDASGQLIGQVSFDSQNTTASFVGLDSGSTAIAMVSFGNDD